MPKTLFNWESSFKGKIGWALVKRKEKRIKSWASPWILSEQGFRLSKKVTERALKEAGE